MPSCLSLGKGPALASFKASQHSHHSAQLHPLPQRHLSSLQHLAEVLEVLDTVQCSLLSVLFFSQDPTNLDKFNVSNFFLVQNNMRIIDPVMDT